MEEQTKVVFTLEDYLRACEALSRCSIRTLPYVLQLLREAGFTIAEVEDMAHLEPWAVNFAKGKTPEQRRAERIKGLLEAFEIVADDNIASIGDLSRQLGYTQKTIRTQLAEAGCFTVRNGLAVKQAVGTASPEIVTN